MMKIILLSLCFAAAAGAVGLYSPRPKPSCSSNYLRMLKSLHSKINSQLDNFSRRHSQCFIDDLGYQPSCIKDEPVTQAIARINEQGTITSEEGYQIDYNLEGIISFKALDPLRTKIYAVFTGVQAFYSESDQFSLHIHQKGDTSPDCGATGSHYDPCNTGKHSDDPKAKNRHVGDVAKVTLSSEYDTLIIDVIDTQVKLSGPLSVLGRSVTVHAGKDAARVGCATIAVTEWAGGDKHPDALALMYTITGAP